jgi:hypothetical protein
MAAMKMAAIAATKTQGRLEEAAESAGAGPSGWVRTELVLDMGAHHSSAAAAVPID